MENWCFWALICEFLPFRKFILIFIWEMSGKRFYLVNFWSSANFYYFPCNDEVHPFSRNYETHPANEIFRIEQSKVLPSEEVVKEAKATGVVRMKEYESQRATELKTSLPTETQRKLEQLSQPGASSWLGALPLESQGFNLTRGEFQDALALRYDKPVKKL